MQGAIYGDIIGSIYEWDNVKTTDFELFTPKSRFTDDTVLTLAIADCLLHGKDYAATVRAYGLKYPMAGYGGRFKKWLAGLITGPYNSWGNGSAMRVSPVAYAFDKEVDILKVAEETAVITHNHPEGIKGAQAMAMAIFLARKGHSKAGIKNYITQTFGYDLDRTIADIRPTYEFDVSCQGSVPESIIAFLESTDYESALRLGISIGGDSDTIACMTGGIAGAFYKNISTDIVEECRKRLPDNLLVIMDAFEDRYAKS